jgi:hypothetical protein
MLLCRSAALSSDKRRVRFITKNFCNFVYIVLCQYLQF